MGDVPASDGLRESVALVHFAGLVLNLEARTLARESGEVIALTRGEFAAGGVFANPSNR